MKELSRSSQDSFESDSDSKESQDVRLDSPKSGVFSNMPLLGELSQPSQDSCESDSDSKESRDDRLNSFKSGILRFFRFDRFDIAFDSIDTASEGRGGPP